MGRKNGNIVCGRGQGHLEVLTSVPFCFSFHESSEPLSEGLSQLMVARSSNTLSPLGRRSVAAPCVAQYYVGNLGQIRILSSSVHGN